MSPTVSKRVADLCDKANDDYIKEFDKNQSSEGSTTKTKEPVIIIWRNVVLFASLHLASLYSIYLMFKSAKWQTNVFALVMYIMTGVGVTAGAHRLWAHRSYKATLPLRIVLALFFTAAVEHDIYDWCRDHRVHHKYTETNADPHNAKRGFFFSHIGWLMCRKHPDVTKIGKNIDLSDVLADPVVKFQRKYYWPLVLVFSFILPTVVPMHFWNETIINAVFVPVLFRICFLLNQTWLVNSAAHLWGSRPYDVNINPRQNPLSIFFITGEGFHNYHHTFPYDYAASEFGSKYNFTTAFINFMALFGLAYDRKTASRDTIKARKLRTGDASIKETSQPDGNEVKEE